MRVSRFYPSHTPGGTNIYRVLIPSQEPHVIVTQPVILVADNVSHLFDDYQARYIYKVYISAT